LLITHRTYDHYEYYVRVPVTAQLDGDADEDVDYTSNASKTGWTANLITINWYDTATSTFVEKLVGSINQGAGLFPSMTRGFPNTYQEWKASDYEYLGYYQDYYGYYRDYVSEGWSGWYNYYDPYNIGDWAGDSYVAGEYFEFWLVWWGTKYYFINFTAPYDHYSNPYDHWGAWRNYYSTWDHVAWTPSTRPKSWDQVAVDYHWQYRGHIVDNGSLQRPSGDWNDYWQQNLRWTNNIDGVPNTQTRATRRTRPIPTSRIPTTTE